MCVCVGWMDLPGTALSHSSLLGPSVGDRSSSLGGIPMLGCCRVSASALVQGPPDPAVRGLLGSVDEFRERHASARKAAGVVSPPEEEEKEGHTIMVPANASAGSWMSRPVVPC